MIGNLTEELQTSENGQYGRKSTGKHVVFIGRKLSLSTLELLNSLLKMDPKLRIKPYHALTLPYFDDLRDPHYKLPSGAPAPLLFDWLEKEYIANHEIIKDIFPRSEEGDKVECL